MSAQLPIHEKATLLQSAKKSVDMAGDYYKVQDIITKQIGKGNKLYSISDIEELPFVDEEDIKNDK